MGAIAGRITPHGGRLAAGAIQQATVCFLGYAIVQPVSCVAFSTLGPGLAKIASMVLVDRGGRTVTLLSDLGNPNVLGDNSFALLRNRSGIRSGSEDQGPSATVIRTP